MDGYIRASVLYPYVFVAGPNKRDCSRRTRLRGNSDNSARQYCFCQDVILCQSQTPMEGDVQGLGIIPANTHDDVAASNIALCAYPRLIGHPVPVHA